MTQEYVDMRKGKSPLRDDIREVLLGSALVDMGFEPRANQDSRADPLAAVRAVPQLAARPDALARPLPRRPADDSRRERPRDRANQYHNDNAPDDATAAVPAAERE